MRDAERDFEERSLKEGGSDKAREPASDRVLDSHLSGLGRFLANCSAEMEKKKRAGTKLAESEQIV